MTSDRHEALAAAGRLSESLDSVRDALQAVDQGSQQRDADLKRYGRRNRLFVAVDVLVTLIATAALAVSLPASTRATTATVAAAAAKSNVRALRQSQIGACEVGNQLRAKNVQLWVHFAAISKPPPHATPAELRAYHAQVAAILGYVRKTFPQLNCQALYRDRSP